jgi:nickel-dependent lactate racemase
MFGSIPQERIHAHDWKNGVTHVGTVPSAFVRDATGGAVDQEIPVDLNTMLMGEHWDLIVNIGHVVPHEVLGFANHNKNYFVGLGSDRALGASHLAAAMCGIENTLGNLVTPVRRCFNYAEEMYLGGLPDVYVQVVLKDDGAGHLVHTGVFVGDDFDTYLQAAKLSREQNITAIEQPFRKVVAFMAPDEYHATWIANKAVYRTRMAMADGGELIVLAPGVERFGEQPGADEVIRTYGYISTAQVLQLYKDSPLMQANKSAVAHLMHGAPEGRFTVTYAPGKLTRQEIESVGYHYMDVGQALARYNPDVLHDGFNRLPDGEEVFFISNPAAGLCGTRERLYNRPGETL